MMLPLKAFGVATRVTLRRLFRGPRRPTWSWKYEWYITLLRDLFSKPLVGREAQARANLDRLGLQQLNPDVARLTEIDIKGIPARWAEPTAGESSGIVLYLHGGGYVIGSTKSHTPYMAALSQRCRARVLGVDYRLAPEHPCPAAIEDVLVVYQWLLDQGEDPGKIVLAGDSAGGGLTVSSLVAIRDRQLPLPAGAILISPWPDLTLRGDSYRDNASYDYIQEREIRQLAGPGYYARDLGPTDPRVSPVNADLHSLPPLLIFAGAAEVLRDSIHHLAQQAKEAGVQVDLVTAPDEIHTYALFIGMSPEANRALDRIAAFLQQAVHPEQQRL